MPSLPVFALPLVLATMSVLPVLDGPRRAERSTVMMRLLPLISVFTFCMCVIPTVSAGARCAPSTAGFTGQRYTGRDSARREPLMRADGLTHEHPRTDRA